MFSRIPQVTGRIQPRKWFRTDGVGKWVYNAVFTNPIGRWVTNLGFKKKRTSKTDLTRSFAFVDHFVTHNYLKIDGGQKNPMRLAHLTIPVDSIYGENTFGAVRISQKIWQEVWPHARTLELKGAGHLPIQEATADLAGIVFSQP